MIRRQICKTVFAPELDRLSAIVSKMREVEM
jgi:hypothetical protein